MLIIFFTKQQIKFDVGVFNSLVDSNCLLISSELPGYALVLCLEYH